MSESNSETILKIGVHICQSYGQIYGGIFLLGHSVDNVNNFTSEYPVISSALLSLCSLFS